jgi:hypothetical protein
MIAALNGHGLHVLSSTGPADHCSALIATSEPMCVFTSAAHFSLIIWSVAASRARFPATMPQGSTRQHGQQAQTAGGIPYAGRKKRLGFDGRAHGRLANFNRVFGAELAKAVATAR